MARRGCPISQADIARVLRAYRRMGLKARVVLTSDGSTAFEPIEKGDHEAESERVASDKEIVL